jgi:hypothetical protein
LLLKTYFGVVQRVIVELYDSRAQCLGYFEGAGSKLTLGPRPGTKVTWSKKHRMIVIVRGGLFITDADGKTRSRSGGGEVAKKGNNNKQQGQRSRSGERGSRGFGSNGGGGGGGGGSNREEEEEQDDENDEEEDDEEGDEDSDKGLSDLSSASDDDDEEAIDNITSTALKPRMSAAGTVKGVVKGAKGGGKWR